jgi:hypothetical protein
MAKRWVLFVAGLVALSMVMTHASAFADSEVRPFSYTKPTQGDKYIFVMLAREPVEQEVSHWIEERQSRIREIRKTYKQSGLYRNDGSAEPLWTVDWYALSVDIASDGIHLVRHGPWPATREDRSTPLTRASLDQEALSFIANGQLLRSYKIEELVTNPARLPRSVSHFHWLSGGALDDERLEYRFGTEDGNHFVIDARTGEIITESRVSTDKDVGAKEPEVETPPAVQTAQTTLGRTIVWGVAIGFGVPVIALSVWLVVRDRRRRSQPPKV